MSELTLYELTENQKMVMQYIDALSLAEADPETLTEEERETVGKLEAVKEEINNMIKEKSGNIIALYKTIEMYEESFEKEEKRFKEKKNIAKNKKENLKGYLLDAMESLGIEKLETNKGNITKRKSPESVEIIDLDRLPAEFKKTKIIVEPDKTLIKKHTKETGELVEGTKLIRDKYSLMIK